MSILVKCCLALLAASVEAVAQSTGSDAKSLDSLPLEQLMDLRVQTPTLKKQSLQDAPASVTVITAEDIHRYGYRTLGELLSNVRSFYATSDGPGQYVGARGFSLLGDFITRFLVLINGHNMTDNVFGGMYYFGEDFPLDLDLVQQIEIVRGPSSALYGSNGVFATINIITKTPTNSARERVSMEVGPFGEKKLTVSTSLTAGRDAKVLVSASILDAGGRHVDFPDLAAAGISPSGTDHAGEESGYRLFADLTWKHWTVMALFGQHKAIIPTGWYQTTIGDTGTTDLESRNFVEAVWNRALGQSGAIRWRAYYDQYRYDGVYDEGIGFQNFDGAAGDWVGSQLVYQHDTGAYGTLTVGGEASADLRNLQYNFDVVNSATGQTRTDHFRISHKLMGLGLFAQQELKLSQQWTLYLGGRLDYTSHDAMSLSPRVAVVYKRDSSTYKLMYGRAFRNPSTYERYWEPNPALEAERIDTFEVAREQSLHRRVNLITSAFHYRLGGLIVGVPVGEGILQYQNASKANATGLEVEVNGQPTDWLETAASFSMQRTRGVNSEQMMENSPVRLGQFRASVPLARQRLMLAGAVRYLGSRLSAYGYRVPAVTLADVTLTAPHLHPRLELQLGIRNLLNTVYSDPLSPEHSSQLMPGRGRSVYVRATWRHE
jgi:outer membrane receptor protein involved in Fe transport